MNRPLEQGNTTLGFVLLLFALGTLMLSGLQQQLSHQRHLVASEVGFLKQYAQALSAQSWGSLLRWNPQQTWQCQEQSKDGWKVCVLAVEKNVALMAAYGRISGQQTPMVLWQWGMIENSDWISTPHGWLDFCPFAEEAKCHLPQ